MRTHDTQFVIIIIFDRFYAFIAALWRCGKFEARRKLHRQIIARLKLDLPLCTSIYFVNDVAKHRVLLLRDVGFFKQDICSILSEMAAPKKIQEQPQRNSEQPLREQYPHCCILTRDRNSCIIEQILLISISSICCCFISCSYITTRVDRIDVFS